jgi:hypothetical protein
MSKPFLKVTEDRTKEFNEMIKSFKNDEVLVGIPAVENQRDDGPIGNAAILAINEYGSPINNIPPRPVMAIGIRTAQDDIAEEFKKAVKQSLKVGLSAIKVYYERAGIIASNSIKKAINSQEGLQPLSEATLAARRSAGFKGTKALLVTAQLRNAITYVVNWGKK